MTQLESAAGGCITLEMERAAAHERVSPRHLCQLIAKGQAVLPANRNRLAPNRWAIGKGLRTKVNANIGTSTGNVDLQGEVQKALLAVKYGADAVMDLSSGGPLMDILHAVLEACPVAVGTVPLYHAAIAAAKAGRDLADITAEEMFQAIEDHARAGVDFVTVHCGVTRASVRRLEQQGRRLKITSRGGSILAHWMRIRQEENPLFARFDDLLEIARQHDVTLSLGDGLRPGCLEDSSDRAQLSELIEIGDLVRRCRQAGVQAMVEGPGHMAINEIEANVVMEKKLCEGAPFYVLGPLPTDIAPGYDHIVAAIGGAVAASAGADFLCYVTPAEHLRLPDEEDVRQGVVATRIAAHIADIAKGVPGALDLDMAMGKHREALDWKGMIGSAMDPERAQAYREDRPPPGEVEDTCSMCGPICAIRVYAGRGGMA